MSTELATISGNIAAIARKISNSSSDLPPSYSRVSYSTEKCIKLQFLNRKIALKIHATSV